MKQTTKNIIALPGVLFVFIVVAYTWYFIILRPQFKTATHFLEALRTRDAELLQETVAPEEYAVYKRLYLRSGFNKHLLSYDDLVERDANNHFFPISSRFSAEVEENDIFFGVRKQTYFIAMEKRNDKWVVIQFSTLQDYDDLKKLKEFKPPSPEEAAP